MLVGIHQPHYLPWLRYFEKIDACDAFIVLDTAHYSKNGWQNRNKIKTAQGELVLTIPVHARLRVPLTDIEIDDTQHWRARHKKAIEQNYHSAPYFDAVVDDLRDFYEQSHTSLVKLNCAMLRFWCETIGISTPVYAASELDVSGEATERLARLVLAVGGDTYYSGAYALDAYLDSTTLNEFGIDLQLQAWSPPVYPQRYGAFLPDLSILDLVMNTGPGALRFIRQGGGRHD